MWVNMGPGLTVNGLISSAMTTQLPLFYAQSFFPIYLYTSTHPPSKLPSSSNSCFKFHCYSLILFFSTQRMGFSVTSASVSPSCPHLTLLPTKEPKNQQCSGHEDSLDGFSHLCNEFWIPLQRAPKILGNLSSFHSSLLHNINKTI